MKHINKIVALTLALVLVLGLATTASAAEDTYTITINNSAAGHTYEAYQIFKGNISNAAINDNGAGTSAVLSDIEWGSNISDGGQTALQSKYGASDAAGVAAALTSANIEAFAADVSQYLTGTAAGTSTQGDDSYTIDGLAPGYYLVKDRDASLNGSNDSYTRYIIEVIENSTVNPKSAVPEISKKVKDINDSVKDSLTDWQDSADYDIGDAVPFQLKGTVASNYDKYTNYYFAFHDVEEAGLTFQRDSVEVYVDSNLITSGYEVVTNTTDGCTFEVVFEDLTDIASVHAGSAITVEYESILNGNANIGNQGNVNKAMLEFSNNPNEKPDEGEEDEDHGKTPWDNVIVFTYKVVVNKVTPTGDVDEEGKPIYKALPDAGFTLYKKNADGVYEAVGEELTGAAMTTFTWTGLDDGAYKLSETHTPAGYNTIEDIEFTVTADHDILWTTQGRMDVLNTLSGDVTSGEITFTASKSECSLTTDVVNQSGATLPETGGIGTTIFYVIGSLMVIGATVLLVTKKRMASAE